MIMKSPIKTVMTTQSNIFRNRMVSGFIFCSPTNELCRCAREVRTLSRALRATRRPNWWRQTNRTTTAYFQGHKPGIQNEVVIQNEEVIQNEKRRNWMRGSFIWQKGQMYFADCAPRGKKRDNPNRRSMH